MQTILRAALALAAFATLASCESAPPLATGEGPLPPDGARYAAAPFPAPASFTATGTGDASPAVVLSWEDVPGDEGYLVQWRQGETGTWKGLVSTGANRTTYSTDRLSDSLPNYYRVAVTTSDFRLGAFSTVLLGPRLATQPAALPADSLAELKASLQTYGSAATYWFEWSTDSLLAGAARTPVRPVGATAGTIAERVAVVPGATYYFRAAASNAAGTFRGLVRRFNAGAPDAPTGVTAAFSAAPRRIGPYGAYSAAHHVFVQWTHDGNDVLHFRAQRRLVGATLWLDFDYTLGTDPRSMVDDGFPVTEDRQWDYRVLACNVREQCRASAEVRVATQGLPAPAGFTATRLADGRVELTWQDLPTNESFSVQWRANETEGNWYTLVSTGADATSYITDRVGPGVAYRVAGEVRSSRTGEFSEASTSAEPLRVHTGGFTVPSLTSATVSATVTPNELAATAWIEWGTDPTFARAARTPSRSLGAGAPPTSFTDTLAVAPGRTYYYRAAASNSVETVHGSRQSFQSAGPSEPIAAAAFDLPNYRIVVSWRHDGVGTPARFQVDRRAAGLTLWTQAEDTTWTQVKEVDASQPRSYLDASFPANVARAYQYRVRACNAAGECSTSSVVRAGTQPLAAPAPLTVARAANGQVTVSWEDITGEAAFAVQWRNDPAAPWKQLVSTGANTTSYTTSSVTPGVTNYYRVAGEASGFRQGLFTQPAALAP